MSVNWQKYDRHFHTFLESTEYFSTLWGSPFPVNLSRKGTTGKKVRSINFFVEEGVRELRSQTAPVPFRCFNQSSEDGKIVGQSKSSMIGLPMKPRRRVLSKSTHQLRASSSSTPFHLNVCAVRLSRHPDLAQIWGLRTDWMEQISIFEVYFEADHGID